MQCGIIRENKGDKMIDLTEVLTRFPEGDAYHILNEIVNICGIGSVLFALSEIMDAKQFEETTTCPHCEARTVDDVCMNLNCDGGIRR